MSTPTELGNESVWRFICSPIRRRIGRFAALTSSIQASQVPTTSAAVAMNASRRTDVVGMARSISRGTASIGDRDARRAAEVARRPRRRLRCLAAPCVACGGGVASALPSFDGYDATLNSQCHGSGVTPFGSAQSGWKKPYSAACSFIHSCCCGAEVLDAAAQVGGEPEAVVAATGQRDHDGVVGVELRLQRAVAVRAGQADRLVEVRLVRGGELLERDRRVTAQHGSVPMPVEQSASAGISPFGNVAAIAAFFEAALRGEPRAAPRRCARTSATSCFCVRGRRARATSSRCASSVAAVARVRGGERRGLAARAPRRARRSARRTSVMSVLISPVCSRFCRLRRVSVAPAGGPIRTVTTGESC